MIDATSTFAPIKQPIQVTFEHLIEFTTGLFQPGNTILSDIIEQQSSVLPRKLLCTIDSGVSDHHPGLISALTAYCERHKDILNLVTAPLIIPGGEACKNDPALIEHLRQHINRYGIDRHSYIIAIGGGAVLDLVGYVAATAHRGVRHIRVPTTVLSQNDSGVGVKNGVNAFGKKNFIGTFAPPAAVICDFDFLATLSDRDWVAGVSEAVKVALLKDQAFFSWIQQNVPLLLARDPRTMHRLIYWCAKWHVDHIGTGGDPFETGSARPLDFGHWAAHKLEQLSGYQIRHGEAVAVGISLDATYSLMTGMLPRGDWRCILTLFQQLGLPTAIPATAPNATGQDMFEEIASGLEEFREHIGGPLTLIMLEGIGKPVEIYEVDHALMIKSIETLRAFS